MKKVARYRTLRVVCVGGAIGAVLLGNFAFDVNATWLVFVAAVLAFVSIGGLAIIAQRLGQFSADGEMLMSDSWIPRSMSNPGSGLPMIDSFVDIHQNLYGSGDNERHRRGG